MASLSNFSKVITIVTSVIGAVVAVIGLLYTSGVIGNLNKRPGEPSPQNVHISILEPQGGNITIHNGRTFPIKIETFGVSDDHDIYIFLEQESRIEGEWWLHHEDEGIAKNEVWSSDIYAGTDIEPVQVMEKLNLWIFAAKPGLFNSSKEYKREDIREQKIIGEKEIELIVNFVE